MGTKEQLVNLLVRLFLVFVNALLLCPLNPAECNLTIDLPFEHIPFYFNQYPLQAEECEKNPNCPLKVHLNKNVCWGYEGGCELNPRSYSHPLCDGDSRGWVATNDEQIKTFYSQADFGYIRSFRDSIKSICTPRTADVEASSLECSENLTFCRGRNLVIDFRDLPKREKPIMYDTDVLKEGQIGGQCKLDKELLTKNLDFMGSLQSWAPEIQHFRELPESGGGSACDTVVSRPTIIMKIDATVNMYHHFCDFFNLYASLHINGTKENPELFSRENQILIWRTFPYQSNFHDTFTTFSEHPILDLNTFAGKKVCFKNAIFPLLPRMIFGLFYNTPLIWGCRRSGLFHAFSKFTLHRLRIDSRPSPNLNKIKITFLSRQTAHRRVLNEDALLAKLRQNPKLHVKKVNFNHEISFLDQLRIIQDTDILIGIHGAGLTHLLFLPDWAVVFELYNCEDPNCYSDLARLRGLKYLTWRDTSKLKYQDIKEDLASSYFQKHANYIFDSEEFLKIVYEGVEHVQDEAKLLNIRDEL